jgi:hypothetical protein
MAYTKFDPRGQRGEEESLIPRRQTPPIVITIQLLAIFLIVRIVMVISGIMFISIPIIDPFLAYLVNLIAK